MPHSNADSTMTPRINGEATPASAFLSHLYSYPVISDLTKTLTSHPYTSAPISYSTASYEKLSKPILPYLRTPLSYLQPYAEKADSIGDSTLSSIDTRFPVVKKPTQELYADGKAAVFFPLRKGNEGKDWVLNVYGSEFKKVGGDGGLMTYGKAMIATGMVASSEALEWLGKFLGNRKQQVKEVANEKTGS